MHSRYKKRHLNRVLNELMNGSLCRVPECANCYRLHVLYMSGWLTEISRVWIIFFAILRKTNYPFSTFLKVSMNFIFLQREATNNPSHVHNIFVSHSWFCANRMIHSTHLIKNPTYTIPNNIFKILMSSDSEWIKDISSNSHLDCENDFLFSKWKKYSFWI